MSETKPSTVRPDSAIVRAAFDRHGHGFHYAVVRELGRLVATQESVFRVEGIEYPVMLNDEVLHVDVILRSSLGLLVLECKRVDPAFSTWCFARSKLVSRSIDRDRVVLEWVLRNDDTTVTVGRNEGEITDVQYHVGLELKHSDLKGDSSGRGLDGAVTQALRSAGGIVLAAIERPNLLGAKITHVVPVIVTTARLVTCDIDLADSDLMTGRLPHDVMVTERKWVWYRTMISAALRHHVSWFEPERQVAMSSFQAEQDHAYARSVAVVTPAGLSSFLGAVRQHIGDY